MTYAIRFRPLRPGDHDTVLRAYTDQRRPELVGAPWSEQERAAIMAQQLTPQAQSYNARFRASSGRAVIADEDVVGRLWTCAHEGHTRILDFCLVQRDDRDAIARAVITEFLASSVSPVRVMEQALSPHGAFWLGMGFQRMPDPKSAPDEPATHRTFAWDPPGPGTV